MFKKVLVAEDLDSINHAVASVLKDLNIKKVSHAQYCDKAWLLAKKAILDQEPYELLICDLSFKKDHRNERIGSGKELIALLKQEDPNLKVLVNSIEDHPHVVNSLWKSGNIEGYVCKDRNGMKELRNAVLKLAEGEEYHSEAISDPVDHESLTTLNDFEVNLLTFIANGLTQDEIQEKLKEKNITPNSKSSIEKRLKELREEFNARTTPHLIGIVKDLNLI